MADQPAPPDVITLAVACLAAARASEGEVAAYYCATARAAIERLDENLKRLRLNLVTIEAELVRRSKGPTPPGLTCKP